MGKTVQKIGKFARAHFSVFDGQLRREIQEGVVPHFKDTFALGFFTGHDADHCLDHISAYAFVVGISALPADNGFAVINTCHEKQQPCGVIVRTHDLDKWRRLAELQRKSPFMFIVAVGGPRAEFGRMFPDTPILSDISDLVVPGVQVAVFISEMVDREQERYLESRQLEAVS